MKPSELIGSGIVAGLFIALCAAPLCHANPTLTPGVWKNISPPGLNTSTGFGVTDVVVDPGNPSVIYTESDADGGFKSIDGGATWAPFATFFGANGFGLKVDPKNSLHMYLCRGVRGDKLGFWVTTDGGANWTQKLMPAGTTDDIGSVAVDPSDFSHVLVGSHSAWSGSSSAGIVETKDGAQTWIVHQPVAGWGSGTGGLAMLYEPTLGIGTPSTWLMIFDGSGGWRTTDAGAHWTQLAGTAAPHGGLKIYYAKTGVVYAGGTPYPMRSTDNGITWTSLSNGNGYFYYTVVMGDGNYLYTMEAFASACGTQYGVSWHVSKETDGLTWTVYKPSASAAQTFDNGPYTIAFDKVNRIMYAANWCAGLWALKVIDPVTATTPVAQTAKHSTVALKSAIGLSRTGVTVRNEAGRLYDVKGRMVTHGK